jgi:hypothetical protein
VYDDAATAARIDANDGVDGTIPRFNGFGGGERAFYWHFGGASATPMDAYVPCRRVSDRYCETATDHPMIVDAVPGDAAYSPYLRIHRLPLTDRWAGERIPSFDAVDEAVRAGLADEPGEENLFAHCPIVHLDTRLDVGTGEPAAPTAIYVRGTEARCFDFTPAHRERPLDLDGTVVLRNVYVLTREGDAGPLVEELRGADLTGDGDLLDTNNIVGATLADADYTPMWRVVMVTVPAAYASIDTAMDETSAEYRSSHDMFDVAPDYTLTPIAGRVVSHEETLMMVNCPLQSAPGAL